MNDEEYTRVQITAVCDFYKWGDHEPAEGPRACDLAVGQTVIPNRSRTRQQFSVQSAKVIQG